MIPQALKKSELKYEADEIGSSASRRAVNLRVVAAAGQCHHKGTEGKRNSL